MLCNVLTIIARAETLVRIAVTGAVTWRVGEEFLFACCGGLLLAGCGFRH